MKPAATVSEKGQVTIPKEVRVKLGLVPGSKLAFSERQGELVAVRAASEDPIGRLVGLGAKRGVDVDSWLEGARGPAWSAELDRE
jgi:antitoxin PrlF